MSLFVHPLDKPKIVHEVGPVSASTDLSPTAPIGLYRESLRSPLSRGNGLIQQSLGIIESLRPARELRKRVNALRLELFWRQVFGRNLTHLSS
jgi:hypothetical protein